MGFPIMHHYSRLLTLDMEDKHNIWCVMSGIDGDLLHCINPLVVHVSSLSVRQGTQPISPIKITDKITAFLGFIAACPLYQTKTISLLFIIMSKMLVSQQLENKKNECFHKGITLVRLQLTILQLFND